MRVQTDELLRLVNQAGLPARITGRQLLEEGDEDLESAGDLFWVTVTDTQECGMQRIANVAAWDIIPNTLDVSLDVLRSERAD
jgi:hypothetical protein